MRSHKLLCIAALVLMVASLLLVATDGLIGLAIKHSTGNCPVCTWASSLSVSQVPARLTWVPSEVLRWAPREATWACCEDFFWRPFSARSPPAASVI